MRPKFDIAACISAAIRHRVGIEGSDAIVAINTDISHGYRWHPRVADRLCPHGAFLAPAPGRRNSARRVPRPAARWRRSSTNGRKAPRPRRPTGQASTRCCARAAVDLAPDGERRGHAYCATIAATTGDAELRTIASPFADEEAEHVKAMETLLAGCAG